MLNCISNRGSEASRYLCTAADLEEYVTDLLEGKKPTIAKRVIPTMRELLIEAHTFFSTAHGFPAIKAQALESQQRNSTYEAKRLVMDSYQEASGKRTSDPHEEERTIRDLLYLTDGLEEAVEISAVKRSRYEELKRFFGGIVKRGDADRANMFHEEKPKYPR